MSTAPRSSFRDLIALARPEYWFKNVFMLLGVVLAYFYQMHSGDRWRFDPFAIAVALVAVCLVASANYVINEWFDAPFDRRHPEKCNRPVARGAVGRKTVVVFWAVLLAVGCALAWSINRPFFVAACVFAAMGAVYNVPPLRLKDWPYLDVLAESVNNPLRLLLGWFAVSATSVPPLSLVVSYWMAGGFFMAGKRLAEIRSIGDRDTAGAYRPSFRHYDDTKLLIQMFFYATAAALFLGVFIVRYHVELILSIPLIAGFFAFYLSITLKPHSAAGSPERLYRERRLMAYLMVCLVVFVLLMFVELDALRRLLNVPEATVPPLWRL
ncbi:hypothetical protein JCM19992_01270 [Thermostilla marina]